MKTSTPERPTSSLSVPHPFDLASSLESGQSHRWRRDGRAGSGPAAEWHWGVINGRLIKIRPSPRELSGDHKILEFSCVPDDAPGNTEAHLWSYFRLDDDIEAIYKEITRDPRVADTVRRYRGLRLLRVEPWECLIGFICSANSNIPRIHANMEALSESFGQPLTLDGQVRYTFPSPERLAGAGESALRALGLGFRAPYVARAARAVAQGEMDLEAVRGMPYEEAKARLMELPGIGPKVADCVLLHSLDKLEAFPIDVWVRRALHEWYFHGQKPPPDRTMLQWAQNYFAPYPGYAELYLFHGRRLGPRT